MKSYFVIFSVLTLAIFAAFPASALDDTNYGTRLNVVLEALPSNVYTTRGQENPVWSPDGKTIAFTGYAGTNIYTVPATGGEPTFVYDNAVDPAGFVYNGVNYHSGDMVTLGFTPDGAEIIFRDTLLDPARGGIIGPYDFPPSSLYPNGYHSDFVTINIICVIKSVNITTGEVRTFVDEAQDGNMSPDGRYLAYTWWASGDDRGKKWGVKILDLQAGEIRMLASQGTIPCFTPDSKYVIYSNVTGSNMNLFKAPVTGGTPEQITFFNRMTLVPSAADPVVSPDGEWILFDWREWIPEILSVVTHIGAYNIKTKETLKIFPNAECSATRPLWSPDGKKFAYSRENRKVSGYDHCVYISDFPPASVESSLPTSVAEAAPAGFAITGNYPNPFNPSTTISFTLPTSGTAALAVYDITGRKVRNLVNGVLSAGSHEAVWNGRDENGKPVSSGVYIARLRSEGNAVSTRMMLVK